MTMVIIELGRKFSNHKIGAKINHSENPDNEKEYMLTKYVIISMSGENSLINSAN